MLVLQLKEAMLNRGIKPSPYLLSRFGISVNVAKHYLSGTAKSIKLVHLYKLCLYLNCTPHELLRVDAKTAAQEVKGTPLEGWTATLPSLNVNNFIMLTPTQLQKAQDMLQQIVKGE